MSVPEKLFMDRRACVCCEREATPRRPLAGEPNIMAISFTIYYKGQGKKILKAARKVRICTECLTRVLAAPRVWEGREARRFLMAIRKSISERYSSILKMDAEVLPEYALKNSGELAGELFGGAN